MQHFLKAQFFGLFCILLAANAQAQADSWEWLHKIDQQHKIVSWVADNVIAVYKPANNKWQLINGENKLIHPAFFTTIPVLRDDLIVFYDYSFLYGAMDKTGKEIIKPQFKWMESFNKGLALVSDGNESFLINKKVQKITWDKIHPLLEFNENKSIWWENQRCYFIDTANNKVFANQDFQDALPFKNGLAAVKNNELWAFINDKGEFISEFKFTHVESFNHNRGIVWLDDKSGLIDTKGNWVIQPIYNGIMDIKNGYFLVGIDPFKYFIVDSNGVKTSNLIYQYVLGFNNGLTSCEFENQKDICDYHGNTIVEAINDVYEASEGFLKIGKKKQFALINNKGQLLANKWFEDCGIIVNGLVAVKENGKWGILDKEGKQRIPFIFELIEISDKGAIWAKLAATQGFIKLK